MNNADKVCSLTNNVILKVPHTSYFSPDYFFLRVLYL